VQREQTIGGTFRGGVAIFLSLAGVTTGMTLLFLGMRAVMDIGGACAEGGPYVPVRPCPNGVPALIVGGLWGGVILAFVYAWQTSKHDVPGFAWALWPALFLSLGWNFLAYGLDPPFGEGFAWGWLVCAVVFFLMGGGPLLIALPAVWRAMTGREPPPRPREALRPPGVTAVASRIRGTRAASGTWPAAGTASGQPDDLVSALERLSYLHRTGAIDDAEYEAAKTRLLEGGS